MILKIDKSSALVSYEEKKRKKKFIYTTKAFLINKTKKVQFFPRYLHTFSLSLSLFPRFQISSNSNREKTSATTNSIISLAFFFFLSLAFSPSLFFSHSHLDARKKNISRMIFTQNYNCKLEMSLLNTRVCVKRSQPLH